MKAIDELKDFQARWASGRGYQVDAKGYVNALEKNLLRPMSAATTADFHHGSGGELKPRSAGRSKMLALHSSSILACNVFDYWRVHEVGLLGEALNLAPPIDRFAFEAQFPTGLPGEPPNLDVALWLHTGDVFAIESKFTEPFGRRKSGQAFKDKYFPSGEPVWSKKGLARCGSLAQALQTRAISFQHLDAAQLLKHILGLNANHHGHFTLAYLYVDPSGPEGEVHREEVSQFAKAIEGEVPFVSLSYATLLSRLRILAGGLHDEYFEYLATRYGLPAL